MIRFFSEVQIDYLPSFLRTYLSTYLCYLYCQVKGACNRCNIICIDQSSGEKTREPFVALASALEGKVRFGIYLSLVGTSKPSYVSIGDDITVEYLTTAKSDNLEGHEIVEY